MYEVVSISFRTGRLERELQMVQLSATRCSCIAILWVILVSSATITLYVSSQRVFIVVVVYFVVDSVRKLLDISSYHRDRRTRSCHAFRVQKAQYLSFAVNFIKFHLPQHKACKLGYTLLWSSPRLPCRYPLLHIIREGCVIPLLFPSMPCPSVSPPLSDFTGGLCLCVFL
jgi:hypothetical protein